MTQVQRTRAVLQFLGVRIQVTTTRRYEEVLIHLRREVGSAPISEVATAAKKVRNRDEFVREVNERWVGTSGFMLFAEIDHGGWIGHFGIDRKAVRWILGNPLVAMTMIRYDIQAGLFVPVELYVVDRADGEGAIVTYLKPSSLIALEENRALREAAEALDEKLDALVMKVTEGE